MNHTKLIHQFFDGGIEGTEEEELFSALAGDQELRREFVEHLKIASFIQHDTSRTGPPPEISNAVFSALGLPQPGAPFIADDESGWKKFGVLIQRILPFAATIFMTVAVTTGVFLLSDQSYEPASAGPAVSLADETSQPADADAVTGQNEELDAAMAEAAGMPETSADVMETMEGSEAEGNADAAPVQQREAQQVARATESRRAVPPGRESDAVAAAAPNAAAMRTAIPAPIESQTALAAELVHMRASDVATAPVTRGSSVTLDNQAAPGQYDLVDMPFGQTPFTIANLIVQLRMTRLNVSLPSVDLPEPTEGVFRDMTITGLYKISERNAIGFTYGRESFGRSYTRTVLDPNVTFTETLQVKPEDYIKAHFTDLDMLDWGGITWKMSHPSLGIFHTFYPFTEITAAVSKYGPVGRALFGIELYPSNSSMLNLGIEVSSLGYKIEDKYYTSNKIGGSLGVALSL